MTEFEKDMNIISVLATYPNDQDGLETQELKEKFDEGGKALKEYINTILLPEIVSALAEKLSAPQVAGVSGQYLRTDGEGGYSWDTPSGSGDMMRSEYDTDGDGTVDVAARALMCEEAGRLEKSVELRIGDAEGENLGEAAAFDGSAGIELRLPQVIAASLIGNVQGNVQGNAATASSAEKLTAARRIDGVAFDGTSDIQTRLIFTNTTVAPTAFVADSTYADYPFRASVALQDSVTQQTVDSNMIPEVVFGVTEALSGSFAPIAATYDGGVYLYASAAPEADITIPTIICWRGN